jgi:hypothetical protein
MTKGKRRKRFREGPHWDLPWEALTSLGQKERSVRNMGLTGKTPIPW